MPEKNGRVRDFMEWAKLAPSQQGYLAPTVFMPKGVKYKNILLYKSREDAFEKLRHNLEVPGSKNPDYIDTIIVNAEQQAQTIGINVDFYNYHRKFGFIQYSYAQVRAMTAAERNLLVIRFTKNDGNGPVYALFEGDKMGVAATPTGKIFPDKLAALDELHRNLQLVMAQYNALSNFINTLSTQKLSPSQKVFLKQALVRQAKFKKELLAIKGSEFSFANKAGVKIGAIQIPVIIAAVIVAGITAYAVYEINKINNVTKQVISNNDLQKFFADYKLKVAEEAAAGIISKEDEQRLLSETNAAEKAAQDNNKDLTKDTIGKDGLLDKITNLVLIGGGIFLVSKFIK